MKANNISHFKSIIALFFIVLTGIGIKLQAQNTQPGKMNADIQLSVFNKADHSTTASVFITATGNGQPKRIPAKNAKVNFYTLSWGNEKLIQNAITGTNGKAEVTFPNELPIDTGNNYSVVAKIENDPLYENTEDAVHYKSASLTLKLIQQDTVRTAIATLTEKGKDGKDVAVKDAEIGFFVQRLFGDMPLTDDNKVTTDDNGKAVFIFPKNINIPGGVNGNIDVVVKLSDNEKYGNIEAKSQIGWGIPVPIEKNPFPRALWEASAPPALVITISILFGGVWSIFIYMFYNLTQFKTKKTDSSYTV